jgi:hypothetical protein
VDGRRGAELRQGYRVVAAEDYRDDAGAVDRFEACEIFS